MNLRDETGAALPLAIVIVIIATVIGISLFMISTTETRQVAMDVDKMKAHYIARSGAHAMAAFFIDNPRSALKLVDSGKSEWIDFADGEYQVEIIDESDPEEDKIVHRIESTGRFNNSRQNIEVWIKNEGVSCALYANKLDISGGGNAEISGADVIFGGTEADYDDTIEGILEEGREVRRGNFDFDPVVLPCEDSTMDMFNNCDTWEHRGNWGSRDGELIINENSRYGSINMNGDYLLINAENNDVLLKADSIEMQNNPIIVKVGNNNTAVIVADTIKPSRANNFKHDDFPEYDFHGESPGIIMEATDDKGGFFLIYVGDKYENRGGNTGIYYLDDEGDVHLNVYVQKGGSIDLGGTPFFHGAIYAPEAKSVLFGTAQVKGWVIADEFEIGGGGSGGIIFDPIVMRDVDINFDFYNIQKWLYPPN